MPALALPADFTLPGLVTELSSGDTMFDGREEHYIQVGLSALNAVEAALLGVPEPRTILDLPCGFGRVTRVLRARYPGAAITVCDIDRAAVDFAAATFGARGAYSTPDFRDLQFEGPFDLIWVGSLLTHLPEHRTRQFLDFATRHMGPNSRLVVTSHGEHVVRQLRSWTYGLSDIAACGLIGQYLVEGYGYRGYDGGPDYGISLVARGWYEMLLTGSPLRLQSFNNRGWDRHQDVLVLRRAGSGEQRAPDIAFERPGIATPLPADKQAELDASGSPGFDEGWYRNTFVDVDAAVREGKWASGQEHYLAFGWKEGRPPFAPERTYASRTAPVPIAWFDGVAGGANRISEAWSVSPQAKAEDLGWYFMAHPAVRARSNRMASGSPDQDAYDRLTVLLHTRGMPLPIGRSMSLGCGFGELERDLSMRGLIVEMDAYDIAAGAVIEAERQSRQLGLSQVRYHVANLENIDLPARSVDVVFAHSSVHHVENLESLYELVQRTLKPGGLFHLNEYVGPTRFQWTDVQLELANAFLDSLPPRLRQLPSGEPKEALRRPTFEEMIAADPSEAVRSEALVSALEPFFDIVEYRPLGGTLTHIALGGIAQNFDPQSPEDSAILQGLFATEDAAMTDGRIGSDFATIAAVPKSAAEGGNEPNMTYSFTARAASLFPPARWLYERVTRLSSSVADL
jgi:SAM-dependent methyltransferase